MEKLAFLLLPVPLTVLTQTDAISDV